MLFPFIGIDLHGTLLGKDEKIEERFRKPLHAVLERLKTNFKIYVCTGNDLPFVRDALPPEIFSLFDGCILETGCAISDAEVEVAKTPKKIQELSQKIRAELEANKFPEVEEFRRRLTTISLFCGDPKEFCKKVQAYIENSKYGPDFLVTYSSVAVDVIPKGYNKYVGMRMVAGKNKIIGIADSMNDFALLSKSDFSFAPANVPEEVVNKLIGSGKDVVNITDAVFPINNKVIISENRETGGAIEALNFISRNLEMFA